MSWKSELLSIRNKDRIWDYKQKNVTWKPKGGKIDTRGYVQKNKNENVDYKR